MLPFIIVGLVFLMITFDLLKEIAPIFHLLCERTFDMMMLVHSYVTFIWLESPEVIKHGMDNLNCHYNYFYTNHFRMITFISKLGWM